MPSGILLTGRKFGRLTVGRETAEDVYLCKCSCGKEVPGVFRSQLTKQVLRSCFECTGLKRKGALFGHIRFYMGRDGKMHQRTSSELLSFLAMRCRCLFKTTTDFPIYGGRGIRICPQWKRKRGLGFRAFLRDMGPRPVGKTLDRINVQGHYEKRNCRWADDETQKANRRYILFPDGKEPPIAPVPKAPIDDLMLMEEGLAFG
jgi:hypothetical protein